MSLTSYRAAPSRDTLFGLPRGALLEPVCPLAFQLFEDASSIAGSTTACPLQGL